MKTKTGRDGVAKRTLSIAPDVYEWTKYRAEKDHDNWSHSTVMQLRKAMEADEGWKALVNQQTVKAKKVRVGDGGGE